MYGHYDYGSHHNVGGSSSQPNFGGSSSQPNVGSSSSQPNFRDSSSPEVLKDSEKWNSGELPAFRKEMKDSKNKRYKLSGSSSFNTKDSGEGSINLNTTVGTEDENEVEEVEEVRRPRPIGRDQAKRKMKAGSASSTSSFDVAELAKMMASEYVMASDPYNTQKKQEMSDLLKIKNRELKLKVAELEIRCMENRQRD
uniref:No apical meristem-associated C-terminal domain-containing protein n=1 Tax=Tanacetum cinerariifolium TaxID=118510 RepID=A0A699HGZ0_TANCI|nr:hypothetical protein [Tanacetum cinerariifolium]